MVTQHAIDLPQLKMKGCSMLDSAADTAGHISSLPSQCVYLTQHLLSNSLGLATKQVMEWPLAMSSPRQDLSPAP